MSLSINSYGTSAWTYDSTHSTGSGTEASSSSKSKQTDKVEFSQQLMNLLASAAQTGLTAGSTSANTDTNSDSGTGSNSLSTEQKKLFLAQIQNKVNDETTSSGSSTSTSGASSLFSSLSEVLDGLDVSSATDEQVDDLYGQVTEAFEENRPTNPYQQDGTSRRMPPPPPPMSSQSSDDQQNSSSDSLEQQVLSAIRDLLSNLTSSTDTADSTDSVDSTTDSDNSTSITGNLLSALQSELNGLDLSTASDDDISNAFDQVVELQKALPKPPAPPQQEEDNSDETIGSSTDLSGVPKELQMMGSVPPPFMWNLNSSESSDDDSDSNNTDSSNSNSDNLLSAASLTTDEKKEILSGLQSALALIGQRDK